MSQSSQSDLFENPLTPEIPAQVVTMFNQLTFEVIEKGFNRYSADAILHRIRWHMQIERREGDFKANNNWTSDLARQFMQLYPQHKGFFETRRRKV